MRAPLLAGLCSLAVPIVGLWVAACGGSSDVEEIEVTLLTDQSSEEMQRELVGTFPAAEAIQRANEIVGFDILVPDPLPHAELRLRKVVAAIHPMNGQPTLVYSELAYSSGTDGEPGSHWLGIRQYAPGRMTNPPTVVGSEKTEVLEIGSSKVYATGEQTVRMTAIGEDHPTFSVSSSGIAEDDVLAMISSLIDR